MFFFLYFARPPLLHKFSNGPFLSEPNNVLDSGFRAVDSGCHSLLVELGLWIAIASGIPDSPSCIPDSKAWDSEFHKQNLPGFRIWIPQAEISGISDSLTWCDTGQLLFQVPSTVSEYGPGTACEIARPKTAVVERARVKTCGDG